MKTEPSLSFFQRYLSIWIFLCIVAGVALGAIAPGIFDRIAEIAFAKVNLVITVLLWVMIYPMMVQVDFSSLKNLKNQLKGSAITLIINWLIKPFSMAAIGVLFFKYIFASFFTTEEAAQYLAGVILLGVAPCTAMVFVWSKLARGDSAFTLVQVALNDVVMIFAFAPIASFLLDMGSIIVPWDTLFLSVFLFVVIPLFFGFATRYTLVSRGGEGFSLALFFRMADPLSMIGLLATVFILFGLQANVIISKPITIVLIAIPLALQTYFIFFVACAAGYFWKIPYKIIAPAALIGTSNFFELSVAVAISLFGLHSGVALATVVGVLVEVPVMLSLVWICKKYSFIFQKDSSF